MRRALLALCLATVVGAALPAPAVAAPDPPAYRPPVDAPVSDPFRAPATPFGPGNRGLEYATEPGTAVRAAAAGRVTFAGLVAGTRHVTVLHDDGIRTSYSYLERIEVVVGQQVRQGTVVGVTVERLHFGARRDDAYFDPASLLESGPPRVHLVPFDEPPRTGAAGERDALRQLVGGVDRLLGGRVGTIAGWLREGSWQLVREVGHYGDRFTFPGFMVDAALTGLQAWQRARTASGRPCSADAVTPPRPAERRVAVLVAGLGSDSEGSAVDDVDTVALGYAPADVLRLSYAGGRVPDPTDGFASVPTSTYDSSTTQADLGVAAAHLADLVEAVAAAAPGTPIDLVAHSQGGVVVRLALFELEERHGRPWLDRLGLIATLGSPHDGADLATAIHAVGSTSTGDRALDPLGGWLGLDPEAPALEQLSESSDVIAELGRRRVPEGIDAVSIAARGDLIVPVPRSVALGMDEVVVPLVGPSAHGDLPGSPEATRELGLALAGLPPGCQSFGDALLDQGMGEAVSLFTDLLGAAGFLTAARADVRNL